MVHAKNYETSCVYILFKIMQKKPWSLFSGHGVYGALKIFKRSSNCVAMTKRLCEVLYNFRPPVGRRAGSATSGVSATRSN